MQISDIYHMKPELLKGTIIKEIKLWAGAYRELKAAVKTLMKDVKEIFNFVKLFPEGTPSELFKKVGPNPEQLMRNVKNVIRDRFVLKSENTPKLYLEKGLNYCILVN